METRAKSSTKFRNEVHDILSTHETKFDQIGTRFDQMECDSAAQETVPEISFHAMSGTTHPQTFRVNGRVKNKEIIILIDGGSTHNFVDQAVVTKFGLPIVNDRTFQCTWQCLGLSLTIQGYTDQTDFYILLVAACQAVLGVQWLETLGPIEMDYKYLTMTFNQMGKPYTLHGLRRTNLQPMTEKEMLNLHGMMCGHTDTHIISRRRLKNWSKNSWILGLFALATALFLLRCC
ncbi:hypothetical protein ACOSP7_024861 [Xanthoceras sorbifolium]